MSALADFLALIPYNMSCAFAFRSPSRPNDETLGLLSEKRCSLCMEDRDEITADRIVKNRDNDWPQFIRRELSGRR